MLFDDQAQVGETPSRKVLLIIIIVQEWKPRWGYQRAGDPKQNWMMEVPANAGVFYIHNSSFYGNISINL